MVAQSDDRTDCKCLTGYYPILTGQDGGTCHACPSGTFKSQQGSAACTTCPENSFSTAVVATSNATCQFAVIGAVCPPGSNDPSLCGCDRGFQSTEIRTNFPNLTRSCGNGNEACPETSNGNREASQGPQHINNGCFNWGRGPDQGWAWYSGFISYPNGELHWARVEFANEAFVTGIQLASGPGQTWYNINNGYLNSAVIVGNDPNPLSTQNSICLIFRTVGQVDDGYRTFNCNTPVRGKFIFISNRCGQGGNGHQISIFEMSVQGYAVTSTFCATCNADKFKDVTGNAACTNCPANTYSNFTAVRNASLCTP